MKKESKIGAAAIVAAMLFSFLSFLSSPQANASGVCDLNNELKKFPEVRGTSDNGGAENIKSELEFRKSYLAKVIDCASAQVSEVQSKISSIKTDDETLKADRDRIVSRFDDVFNYYKIQKESIGDLGIEGSKIFSANLKSWRDSNYEPIVDLSGNFLIYVKNQEIMQTTENRFNQISLSLKALGLENNQEIKNLLDEAEKNLKLAEENNRLAGEIFKNLSWPNDAYKLMASSLEYLKNAYKNFFEIGSKTQDILSSGR